jgi:PEP-CTERM motif
VSSKAKFVITALALAAAASANATSFSSATLGPIQVQLFDLNPLDGVGPSITFLTNGNGSGNYAYAYASNYSLGIYAGETNYGSNSFSSVSANANIPSTFSTASITSGPNETSAQGVSLSASGQVSGTSNNDSNSYSAYALAPNSYYNGNFVLSAYTMVTFSALATSSATTTVGNVPYQGSEYAQASAGLSVSGSAPLGAGYQNSSANVSSYASYTYSYAWDDQAQQYVYTYSGQQDSSTNMVGVSFTNLTSADKQGTVSANVYAYGSSSIAAVPEPETYAMLLAGMGVIATIARRRRA